MCVGNTMQEMMKPKVISNPATAAPPPLAPPPIPIATPSMSKSTEQAAPGSATSKKPKKGNPLRIDLAGTGAGGGSGLNVPI